MRFNQIVFGVGILVLAILLTGALWFFRPWAPYSPAGVWEGRNAPDRTEFYRSMYEVFPHREIAASPNIVTLPRALQPLSVSYTYKGEAQTLESYVDRYDITSLMVVRDRTVIFEEYWRNQSADDLHTSWSVAKSVISMLIGMGIKDGVIDSLDDPAEKYAPVYKGTDLGKTSIRHLLMMSSGLDFKEDYETKGSDMRKLFFNVFFLNRDVDNFIRRYQHNRAPGTDFEYQSPNTIVLTAVVRGAYGDMLAPIVEEKLFAPLGMREGNWLLDRHAKDGKELGYCCLNIRLEDYAKLGLFILDDGMAQGEQLLPEGWVEFVASAPQASHEPDAESDTFGYGHHFWIPPDEEGVVGMAGYNGQIVWVDRQRDLIVVMNGADRKYPLENREFPYMLGAVLDAAAAL